MSARIEEIRQENRGGDVSYRDIEWLCSVADAAEAAVASYPFPAADVPAAAKSDVDWYMAALRDKLARAENGHPETSA